MTIAQWLTTAASQLTTDDAPFAAERLLAERIGKNRAYLHVFPDTSIPSDLQTQLTQELNQLANGYPLAYILGKQAFWDMELRVTEATLIPRADTETLIEVAQILLPAETTAKMVDLGTGSGAIAIALSRVFPRASLIATDMSAAALEVAKANATRWQISPIQFKQTPWLQGFSAATVDVIVSNPPYIAEGDTHLPALQYEPISALTASNQGLADIQTIIEQAKTVLKPQGWLLLEHGYDQGQAVRELLDSHHSTYQGIKTHRDLGSNERITVAQRTTI